MREEEPLAVKQLLAFYFPVQTVSLLYSHYHLLCCGHYCLAVHCANASELFSWQNDQFSLFPPLCHEFCIISERLFCYCPAWWPQGSDSPSW